MVKEAAQTLTDNQQPPLMDRPAVDNPELDNQEAQPHMVNQELEVVMVNHQAVVQVIPCNLKSIDQLII